MFTNYSVEKVDYNNKLREYIADHHYTGSAPLNVRYAFILREGDRLWGICTFGSFSRMQSRYAYSGCLELSRMYVEDGTPSNAESFFLGHCLRWLEKKTSIYGVVSYSSLSAGHRGTVYKACNFKQIGMTEKSYHYESEDKNFIHKRKIWELGGRSSEGQKEWAEEHGLKKVEEDKKIIFKYDFERKTLSSISNQKVPVEIKPKDFPNLPSDFDPSIHMATKFNEKFFLMDRSDYDFILTKNWWIGKNGYLTTSGIDQRYWMFHRHVMGHPVGKTVGHIHGNRWDNRKCNLRAVHPSVNNHNRKNKNDARGVKCVSNAYMAQITFNRKNHYLGRYVLIDDAKRAYDEAAIQFFGVAALTNFPISNYKIPEIAEVDKLPTKQIKQNRVGAVCPICGRPSIGGRGYCKSCDIVEGRRADNPDRKEYVDRIAFRMEACSVPNCIADTFSRNLCSKHYSEERKKEGYIKPEGKDYFCVIEGCGKGRWKYETKMCKNHWNESEGRLPGRITGRPPKQYGICSQCEDEATGQHGFCKKHYLIDWKSKSVTKYEKSKCSIEGCPKFAFNEGMCQAHWRKKTGTPKKSNRKKNPVHPKKPCNAQGCQLLSTSAGGFCLNHKHLYIPELAQ